MSIAETKMRAFNPHAPVGYDQGAYVMIEDVYDSPIDRRLYRLEYQATADGRRAISYLRSNPWDRTRPNCGKEYAKCHVSEAGIICVGSQHTNSLADSPYDLDFVLKRARSFCTYFSAWMEGGCRRSLNDIAMGR